MRLYYQGLFLLLLNLVCLGIPAYSFVDGNHDHHQEYRFIENKGQWDSRILFRCDLQGAVLFLERDRLTFDLHNEDDISRANSFKHSLKVPEPADLMVRGHAYQVVFDGANQNAEIVKEGEFPDFYNYYLGKDSLRWASGVKSFRKITYRNLLPGVDFSIYSQGGVLKYDLILQAGADPELIQLSYVGIDRIRLKEGHLYLNTSVRQVTELRPHAYYIDNQNTFPCNYQLKGKQLSFIFPESYDKKRSIVIDPVLVFSSYTGSIGDNWGYTATYDDNGYLYAGGIVRSSGYPMTTGAYQNLYGGGTCDMGISKFSPNGQNLIYSTYLGGDQADIPHSLVVNNADELYILGTTGSADYPVSSGCFDPTFNGGTSYTLTSVLNYDNGSDIVISRLSSGGGSLLSSTYFGGSANDGLNGMGNTSFILKHNYADDVRGEIIFDAQNNVLIGSCTRSPNLPTTAGAFSNTHSGGALDGLIAKFDASLSALIWSTYFGGAGEDAVYSLVVNDIGEVYAAGGTTSSNLPFQGPSIHPSYQGGSVDGFAVRLSPGGNSLISGTYFGSNSYDQVYNIKLDNKDQVYVMGQTSKTGTYFIKNTLWNTPSGGHFISKLSPGLDSIQWSTAFGTTNGGQGGPDLSPNAFMIDLCDHVYFSGWGANYLNGFGGTSGLPVSSNAFQTTTDGEDYYFLVLAPNADSLLFATFFGGTLSAEHVDGGTSRFDRKGTIYQAVCAGCGNHDDFPTTPNAWSNYNNSNNCNMGVLKIDFQLPVLNADFNKPIVGCAPYTINFQNNSVIPSIGSTTFTWNFGDGTGSSQFQPSHTYTQSGVYNVSLIVSNPLSCNISDTIMRQVLVLSNSRDTLPDRNICYGDYTQIGILPVNDPTVTYQWVNSPFLSSTSISNPIATPLQNTVYTLIVSNGICSDTLIQHVRVYNLMVDAGPDTTLCVNNIKLTAHSNTPGMLFIWSSSPNFSNPINTNPNDSSITVSITSPTTFYVYMFNAFCSTSDSVKVDFRIFLNSGASQSPACFDDCNGVASVSTSGGAPPYSYTWSSGTGNTATLNNLCAGTYTVTATDANGCYAVLSIPLSNPPALLSNPVITDVPCALACIGQVNIGASGGTPSYSYQWNDPGSQNANPATGLCTGTYIVTITDSRNCKLIDTVNVADLSLSISFNAWVDDDTIYEGQITTLHSTNLGSNYSYQWLPTQGLSSPNSSDTKASPTQTTTYTVTAIDIYGCEYTDTVTIWVEDVFCEEPYIFIPNAFTPNGDLVNDILYVRTLYAEEIYLAIYDRWGERVFETRSTDVGWDGSFRGKELDPGVFAYYLEVTCYNKVVFVKKGNITLIR
jgi:gliding motility-associated-like protein